MKIIINCRLETTVRSLFFRKNRWNSTRRICEVLQRKSRRWYTTSRRLPSNSSITGERSPSSYPRRCPRVRRAKTRWRERNTT